MVTGYAIGHTAPPARFADQVSKDFIYFCHLEAGFIIWFHAPWPQIDIFISLFFIPSISVPILIFYHKYTFLSHILADFTGGFFFTFLGCI